MRGSLWTLALLSLAVPAVSFAAQTTPAGATGAPPAANLTVAVIPAQYFSADAGSATALTDSIRQDFTSKGWTVTPQDAVTAAWTAMNLQNGVHYPDRVALQLGQKLNADLIVYPRLLALGIPVPSVLAPAAGTQPAAGGQPAAGQPAPATQPSGGASGTVANPLQPAAVVHIRVLNVKRGRAIYFNQIAEPYTADQPIQVAEFHLPGAAAQLAADHSLGYFFDKVAGSREVLGNPPPAPKPVRHRRTRRGRRRAAE